MPTRSFPNSKSSSTGVGLLSFTPSIDRNANLLELGIRGDAVRTSWSGRERVGCYRHMDMEGGDFDVQQRHALAAQMAAWEKLAMREEHGDAVAEEQAARAVEEAVWAEIQQQEAGREAEKEATWEEDKSAAEEAAARINAEYEAREASRRAALESELKAKAARVAAQHRVWGRARGRIERRGAPHVSAASRRF